MNEKDQRYVFFSYQTWTNYSFNRELIETCIRKAINLVNLENDCCYVFIDAQQPSVAGAYVVTNEIMKKIKRSSIFIVDLTNVQQTGKASPNPNALFECGYAFAKKGDKRCIMVCNTHYGRINDSLPFDLAHRNCLDYYCGSENEREAAIEKLTSKLKDSMQLIIGASANK